MNLFLQVDTWISLLALTSLEIILGVDNLILIAIVTSRLPIHQQKLARKVGLLLAMLMRLFLLAAIVWIAGLTEVLFSIGNLAISIRDLMLITGGIFLIIKSFCELYKLRYSLQQHQKTKNTIFLTAIIEIVFFDILFSLDSVITAVGIMQEYQVMALAIILTVLLMLLASEPVSRFIMANMRIKILALCILILVGIDLILKGLSVGWPTAYIFVAMGFAFGVEIINRWIVSTHAKH
jgi:predicted tellurium resistance membrane protein TerC